MRLASLWVIITKASLLKCKVYYCYLRGLSLRSLPPYQSSRDLMMFCPQVSPQELQGGQDLLLKASFRSTMQKREERDQGRVELRIGGG